MFGDLDHDLDCSRNPDRLVDRSTAPTKTKFFGYLPEYSSVWRAVELRVVHEATQVPERRLMVVHRVVLKLSDNSCLVPVHRW